MAKLVKKKKRTVTWAFMIVAITLELVVYLSISLILNTRNDNLTIRLQNANNRIASIKEENSRLTMEIQSLQNKDRVYVIAKGAGLEQNQDNIVSVMLNED